MLNTVWEAIMFGYKDADGNYINPRFATPDFSTIRGVDIVFTNNISEDTIIQGDLSKYKLVVSKNVTFDMTNSNKDDFEKNQLTKRLKREWHLM